jgi:hypothetical protein
MTTHCFVFLTNAHHLFLQCEIVSLTKLKNNYANNDIALAINAAVDQRDLISLSQFVFLTQVAQKQCSL